MKPSHWSYWAAAAMLSASAHAQVSVRDAWVRGTVAGQGTSGAFMRLESTQNTALVEARSPLAEAVELHSTVSENDVMRMRRVARIEVPALTPVQLRPGSFHVMLIGLKTPLAAGAKVPITLVFEAGGKRSTVELNAEVRALGAAEPHPHSHMH